MKITIIETEYARLSNEFSLSQCNEAIALDIILKKVTMINNQIFSIKYKDIAEYLHGDNLDFKKIFNREETSKNTDFVIIANQYTDILNDVKDKVYNCNLFGDY